MEFEIKHVRNEELQAKEARKVKLIQEAKNKSPVKYLTLSIAHTMAGIFFAGLSATEFLLFSIPVGVLGFFNFIYAIKYSSLAINYATYGDHKMSNTIISTLSTVAIIVIIFIMIVEFSFIFSIHQGYGPVSF